MKFENTQVWGFEHALRGMRNPKDSWHLSDSTWSNNPFDFVIGPKDMKLAKALIHGGPEHRKFLRQIFVSVDITAPLYWFKEFDTYKVGTTANSCSTMHKITSKPITLESFEIDDYNENVSINYVDQSFLTDAGRESGFIAHWHVGEMADYIVERCEDMRQHYIKLQEQMKVAKDNEERERLEYESYLVWKELIRWLPEGWLQKRTVTMTYENLHAMCSKSQRYFHKLNEWSGRRNSELENFIEWVREEIPYAEDFILYHETEDEIKKHNEEVDKCSIFLWGLYSGSPTLFAPPEDNIFKQAVINLPWNYSSDIWMEGFKKMWDTYGEGLPEKGPMCSIADNKLYITSFLTFRKKNEEA